MRHTPILPYASHPYTTNNTVTMLPTTRPTDTHKARYTGTQIYKPHILPGMNYEGVQVSEAQENRLRRSAARQGLQIIKSRIRDPRAVGYGMWKLVDAEVGPTEHTDYWRTLQEVAECLGEDL